MCCFLFEAEEKQACLLNDMLLTLEPVSCHEIKEQN